HECGGIEHVVAREAAGVPMIVDLKTSVQEHNRGALRDTAHEITDERLVRWRSREAVAEVELHRDVVVGERHGDTLRTLQPGVVTRIQDRLVMVVPRPVPEEKSVHPLRMKDVMFTDIELLNRGGEE